MIKATLTAETKARFPIVLCVTGEGDTVEEAILDAHKEAFRRELKADRFEALVEDSENIGFVPYYVGNRYDSVILGQPTWQTSKESVDALKEVMVRKHDVYHMYT